MSFRKWYYFNEFTCCKATLYGLALAYVASITLTCFLEPFIPLSCQITHQRSIDFKNPIYIDGPCRSTRMWQLLFLTQDECDFGRRLVVSVILGGIIGWERRQADRPAGIRTMALVSLAACLFTICSAFAFLTGPMSWDASRISAAIPSGVGFLGAGLIFKQKEKCKETGETNNVVLGLTTATSLWLSAAVGTACGGRLYFVASFSASVMLLLLRFGPRAPLEDVEEETSEHELSERDLLPKGGLLQKGTESVRSRGGSESIRKRSTLSTVV